MSEFFQVELPKKTKPITKEQRRRYNGISATEAEYRLTGRKFNPENPPRRQVTVIENSKFRTKNTKKKGWKRA